MARVTQGILYTLRNEMFRHLHRLPMTFHDRNEIGRVMSRVQNDILNLQEFLSTAILGIADILALGGILVAMFLMEPRLAAATLSVVPVLFIGLYFWQSHARMAFIRVRQAIALVNAADRIDSRIQTESLQSSFPQCMNERAAAATDIQDQTRAVDAAGDKVGVVDEDELAIEISETSRSGAVRLPPIAVRVERSSLGGARHGIEPD
jgi:ABC-type multidrug transport system fused ATPase/permease subunit